MRHLHYETARERQVEGSRVTYARAAIMNNWVHGIIARHTAERQFREAGMFEAEITEALNHA